MEVEWIESHARNIYRAGHKGKVTAAAQYHTSLCDHNII